VNSFKQTSLVACGTLRREVRESADGGTVELKRPARFLSELAGQPAAESTGRGRKRDRKRDRSDIGKIEKCRWVNLGSMTP
jgi:hypothetical protein